MMMGMSAGPDSGGAAAPFVGPFDGLPASSFACSLRRLYSAYTGKAVHVTGAGGASSGDVGFTATGDFDATGYNTLKGSGTESVDTCYDQSGNGRNATQGTQALQPTISLTAANGHAGFACTTNQVLVTPAITQTLPWSMSAVAVNSSGSGAQGVLVVGNFAQGELTFSNLNTAFASNNIATAQSQAISMAGVGVSSSSSQLYASGSNTSNATNAANISATALGLCNGTAGGAPVSGSLEEAIFFPSQLSAANVTTLYTGAGNQKSYYGAQ